MADLAALLDTIVRRDHGRLVGALLRLCGSIDAAEEALQEAMLSALTAWPTAGIPDQPLAWLTTAAKNHARDAWRRRAVAGAKAPLIAEASVTDPEPLQAVSDDRLRLIFTCCHPVLGREAQVALTLKLVAGLSTDAIARAFVCPETTMAQRLVRAKQAISEGELGYAEPGRTELAARVDAVTQVIYLLFNEGHVARAGALARIDLEAEALRLARLLGELLPREAGVYGLVALIALGAARASTRTDAGGVMILLADQDRTRWHRGLIEEALMALARAHTLGGDDDPYVLQAEIAACHVTAPTWAATPWPGILARYDRLLARTRSPVVALNRAVALAMVAGPEAGLAELAELAELLAGYHLFFATRADLRARAGLDPRADYARARELATNDAERAFLDGKLSMLVR